MSLNLNKTPKINLSKGVRINLTKDGSSESEKLHNIYAGANWGAITKSGFLGFGSSVESVDLDLSVLLYDKDKHYIDSVYFGHKVSNCGAIRHSGDDLTGDEFGDDGLDNEIISVDLDKVNPNAYYLVFILNSFRHQQFDELPYMSLRIYTGSRSDNIDEVLASYRVEKGDPDFKGKEAIVLGHFYRKDGWWKFKADGLTSNERNIESISRGSAIKVLN